MDGLITENLPSASFGWLKMWKQKESANLEIKPRFERISVDGDVLNYVSENGDRIGVYIAAQPLTPDHNYFEVELLDTGVSCGIAVGLVPPRYPLDKHPGCLEDSVAYHLEDGKLYRGRSHGSTFISKGEIGDKIGCGARFDQVSSIESRKPVVPVFFTKNGTEVSSTLVHWHSDGLYPAIGMTSVGEEVRVTLNSKWASNEEETRMSVDGHEEDWCRLHDIRLNGQILEYTGQGKSIGDVGLAQARWPLNTTSHYFEIEILDPGENCFIAIGLARKNYPKHRHPGWNTGSIAYHADDGKIFNGSGVGDAFGPKCHKGDIMGCGIIFPLDYSCNYDSDGSQDFSFSSPNCANDELNREEYEGGSQSESEDDLWWNNCNQIENGSKVEVFFTRNGKTIGRKEVCIPKGGFYPTIGMLSLAEKVKVDLRPLSG